MKQTTNDKEQLIINKVFYFKNLKEHFICIICSNLLKFPLMCNKCMIPFCADCIKTWKNSNKFCPNSCLITDTTITEVRGCAKKFLDELKLKCKYGCEISLTEYDAHVISCIKSHQDDINCWNCDNITKANKMKENYDDITEIKDMNEVLKMRFSNESKTLETNDKLISGYNDILQLTNQKQKINKKIFELELKTKEKETIKIMIDNLERDLKYKEKEYLQLKNELEDLNQEKNKLIKSVKELILVNSNKEIKKLAESKELKQALKPTPNQLMQKISLKSNKNLFLANFKEPVIKEQSLIGHYNSVYSIIKLSDTKIATGSSDKTIKIWNLLDSSCENTLSSHKGPVFSLLKLNNNLFASGGGSTDKTIKIWDSKSMTCIETLSGHKNNIRTIIKLNDSFFASGSGDFTIKIWDVNSFECVKTLKGHSDYIRSLVKINNNRMASGGSDKIIIIWDYEKESQLKVLTSHTDTVLILLKVNDTTMLSGSSDNTIKVWNIDTYTCVKTLVGHTEGVNCIILFKDNHILSCSNDKSIKLWSLNSELEKPCIKTYKDAHEGEILTLLKLNDNQIVSGGSDKAIKVWNIE